MEGGNQDHAPAPVPAPRRIEFNRFLDYYKDSHDINARTPQKKAFQKKGSKGKKPPFGKKSQKGLE